MSDDESTNSFRIFNLELGTGRKRILQRKLDRLSDLPDNVIDNILRFLPLQSAVRTSVLSTKWKFNWTRKENLVLDRYFFLNIESFVLDRVSDYMNIVTNVLLSHSGRIRDFHLYVPGFIFAPRLVNAVNFWLLFVLRRGVQDLRLEHNTDCDNNHRVPCSVFQFSELKHLSLRGVDPPSFNFRGVSYLLSLALYFGDVPRGYLSNLFLKCPLLEKIYLLVDHASDPFVVTSSKLKFLCIEYRYGFDLVLKYTPNLSTISLKLLREGDLNSPITFHDIIGFFGAVPKIEDVTVSGNILEVWAKWNLPERLPVPLTNRMNLTFCNLNVYSVGQIRSLACLLKSSPKLHKLDISIFEQLYLHVHVRDNTVPQIKEIEDLSNLKIVKVSHLFGSEIEIAFIEMILSRSIVLEKLYLTCSTSMSLEAELKMATDIMRLRRASTQAEIIYSKPKSELEFHLF